MLWLIPLAPIAAACVLRLVGSERRAALAAAGVAATGLTLILAAAAAAADWSGALGWSAGITLEARLTPASGIVAITVPAVALPVLLFAAVHEPAFGANRLVVLLLVFVGAMELLVVAADLLTLLIGWELVGACSWALIGHDWRERDRPSSATHAFLVTRFGDLGLFVAAAAVFSGAGSFAYRELAAVDGALLHVVVFGIVLSASAKSAQLPFSFWLFRAMAGPTSVSALLHAAAMVAAGAFVLARLHAELDRVDWFGPAVVTIGAATALAGGLVAVLQHHAKKLLAASTSAHYGLMFVAAGAGFPAVAIAHLVTHAGFKALLFLASGIAGTAAGGYALHAMRLGRALPLTSGLTLAGTLALAGVPPLGGAWSKDEVVSAAAGASVWAAAAAVVAGGLSACYAFRFQWLAFGRPHGSKESERDVEKPSYSALAALGLLAAASVALSLLWLPPVETAAARLLGTSFPSPSTGELAVSVGAVLVGVYAARRLVASSYDSRLRAREGGAADWLGLPAALVAGVIDPALRVTRTLARFDADFVDRLPNALARSGRGMAGLLGRADGAIVDGGVRAVTAGSAWLARAGSRVIEGISDLVPEGAASVLGLAAEDARSTQTGRSHQYYVWIAAGTLVMAVILAAAG